MATNRPCPMTTQLYTNPICSQPAVRPILAQGFCPSCSRILHGRWIDILEYEQCSGPETGAYPGAAAAVSKPTCTLALRRIAAPSQREIISLTEVAVATAATTSTMARGQSEPILAKGSSATARRSSVRRAIMKAMADFQPAVRTIVKGGLFPQVLRQELGVIERKGKFGDYDPITPEQALRIGGVNAEIDGLKRYICLICKPKRGKSNMHNDKHCIKSHMCKFHLEGKVYLFYLNGGEVKDANNAAKATQGKKCTIAGMEDKNNDDKNDENKDDDPAGDDYHGFRWKRLHWWEEVGGIRCTIEEEMVQSRKRNKQKTPRAWNNSSSTHNQSPQMNNVPASVWDEQRISSDPSSQDPYTSRQPEYQHQEPGAPEPEPEYINGLLVCSGNTGSGLAVGHSSEHYPVLEYDVAEKDNPGDVAEKDVLPT
ncbi:hypothetical protein F4778DRAFT_778925 [Xylariomycetidae sp. FL2044]|nr:hypothetical protein F4778DRAFT_778925 [Xylariomycetidae sp. FL2044]